MRSTESPSSSAATRWRYELRRAPGVVEFLVFDDKDVDPICRLKREANARRIVESANMTGFPDIAAYAADEAGEDWVPNSSSATVNRWRISQTESRAKLAALVNFAYRGPKADSGGS